MRSCYMCKNFSILAASQYYSDLTPGSSFDMSCEKDVWTWDGYETNEEDFGLTLSTAISCKLFEPAEWVEKYVEKK